MAGSNYTVSVVVPTHNRSCYAIACIQSLLEIDSDKIQIIVHDTSDDECELAAWAEGHQDRRLHYVHWAERLSMTQNHDRAIALAKGEYVCLIGDDDSVSAHILEVVEYAKLHNIELLTPLIKAMYSWPDFKTNFYGSAHAGKFYLGEVTGQIIKKSCSEAIEIALRNACQGTEGLPKLYHGLVKNSLLTKLRNDTGEVFYGTSPDISSSLGLALMSESFHVIDIPFTIPGASGLSNTGRSAVNKHKGDIESDPHMTPFSELSWPKELPYFFSVETVWAHAAWVTLLHRDPLALESFNLSRLFAICRVNHSDYKRVINETASKLIASNDKRYSSMGVLKEGLNYFFERVVAKARRVLHPSPSNGMRVYGPFDDIRPAKIVLDEALGSKLCIKDGIV